MIFVVLLTSFLAVASGVPHEINFCSGVSIHDLFYPSSHVEFQDSRIYSPLVLDGSDSAITSAGNWHSGVTSCTCIVRNGNYDIPKLRIRHSTDEYKTCGKRIELVKFGEKALHTFGCGSNTLELQNFMNGGNITATLFLETPRIRDQTYQMTIDLDVLADLYVSCLPPDLTVTSSTMSSASTSPSSSKTSSTPFSKTSSTSTISPTKPDVIIDTSQDTVIMIAVISCVVVMILLIMACTIWFICMRRRDKRKSSDSQGTAQKDAENPDNKQNIPKPVHEHIYSTISHIYASIRTNSIVSGARRKLTLPKNALDRVRGKPKREETDIRPSGFYDSIKSNAGTESNRIVDMHAMSIDCLPTSGLDKMVLTKADSCDSTKYIHPITRDHYKPAVSVQESNNSSGYINPVMANNNELTEASTKKATHDSSYLTLPKHSDDYLEPVQSGMPDEVKPSEQDTKQYTTMGRNKFNVLTKSELSDSYISSRPRYIDDITPDASNKTLNVNNGKHIYNSDLSGPMPDRDQGYMSMISNSISKLPVSNQASGDYVPMDCTNKGEHLETVTVNIDRDSGYEEPTKTQSKGPSSDGKETEILSHPKELFNMADIDLKTKEKTITVGEKIGATSNPQRPKLKRYVKNIEH